MVGIPRSTGCSTCVKRRIKCDEGQPQCGNCLKYGQPCPGYDKGFKFVVGKPHRAKRQPRAKVAPTSDGLSPSHERSPTHDASALFPHVTGFGPISTETTKSQSTSRYASEAPSSADEEICPSESEQLFADIFFKLPSPVKPHKAYQLQLINSLCGSLPPMTKPNEIQMISSYLSQLPEFMGKSRALDAAAMAFATQQIGTVFSDQGMIRAGHGSYIEALSRLQHALNDRSEALRSETHASAYLLCTYELFAGTAGFTSWMKHAEGLAKLVKHRKPVRYQNEFDVAILRACRGLIIMDCMFAGKEVFLTAPEWREITRLQKPPHMDDDFHNFFEQFMELMAELPALLAKGWDIREAARLGKPPPFDEDEILQLVWDTTEVYTKFQMWANELPHFCSPPTEVPSPSHDPVFPVVFNFESYTGGGVYVNYWACMIILQMILSNCGCLPDPVYSGVELANKICMSVEWNVQGVWGGFRLGFPLRIAFEAATPKAQRWIGEWHIKLHKNYAATSVQGLPSHPIKDELMKRIEVAT